MFMTPLTVECSLFLNILNPVFDRLNRKEPFRNLFNLYYNILSKQSIAITPSTTLSCMHMLDDVNKVTASIFCVSFKGTS